MNLLVFLIISSKCNFSYDSDSFRFLDSCEIPADSQSRRRDSGIVTDPSGAIKPYSPCMVRGFFSAFICYGDSPQPLFVSDSYGDSPHAAFIRPGWLGLGL